jgi:hypothetical protein
MFPSNPKAAQPHLPSHQRARNRAQDQRQLCDRRTVLFSSRPGGVLKAGSTRQRLPLQEPTKFLPPRGRPGLIAKSLGDRQPDIDAFAVGLKAWAERPGAVPALAAEATLLDQPRGAPLVHPVGSLVANSGAHSRRCNREGDSISLSGQGCSLRGRPPNGRCVPCYRKVAAIPPPSFQLANDLAERLATL